MMYPDRFSENAGPGDRIERTEPIGRGPRVDIYADDRPVHRGGLRDDQSLGQLFSELTRDTRTLVRQEIDLARTEITSKASKAGKSIGYIAAGGLVAYAGLIVLLMGVAYLLAVVLPLWLATVIIGAIVIGVGYAFLQTGLDGLKKTDFRLARTQETLQEDKQWIKEQI
ncbi:MAG TPA: phage holin family protein [Rhodothermales bacterium]|nr:phage holin family protein [Rhodothermales bacterium]